MLTKKEMQHKIDYEIIVDCYDETEVAMGWLVYLEDHIAFPFTATAQLKKTDGTTVQKKVKVVGLADHEEGITGKDFNLEIEAGEYISTIAFSKLSRIKASAETLETFAIWKYWIR